MFQIQNKKDHLNNIMLKLLSSVPGKNKIDITYLLDDGLGKRKKKKTNLEYYFGIQEQKWLIVELDFSIL